MADGDQALVERLRAGEDAAFEELVRLHGPQMRAVARRYLPRETDAEDALQDALLSVFRSIGAFEGASRLSTWLHRVTANAALMRIRARNRRPETQVDEAEIEALAERPSWEGWEVATEVLVRREQRDQVRRLLDGLPENQRIVVRLRDIEGMDVSEIERLLGVGPGTVQSRLRRGRLALQAALRAHLEPET